MKSKPVGKAHAPLRRDGGYRLLCCCRSNQGDSYLAEVRWLTPSAVDPTKKTRTSLKPRWPSGKVSASEPKGSRLTTGFHRRPAVYSPAAR
ncbi:hypothetical protein AVEN_159241-1 [Araneus ventricosus]|uniref:Uncharacterized protein n=1 Tax=Araneus ventricosus TaxID=182803 RepID=A0A4Y2A1A6_ARAVE|nr:hypothetical protein AVEN_159241-1 [Araneus ventricosus]